VLEEIYERAGHRTTVRLACLRALGRLESPCGCFFGGLRDPDWRLRATSARFAWIMGLPAVKPLAERLRDEAFYVRLNAAVSLLRLGGDGRRALHRALDGTDRFARDVSAYALARGDALVVSADLTGSYPRLHRFAPRRRRSPRAPQHV
jgi:HEAT repeat protein